VREKRQNPDDFDDLTGLEMEEVLEGFEHQNR
jgi:hypothetical protein